MEYRSSNGGMHIGRDIVASVESSHGVQLSGASTGGVVQAVGDDANIGLSVLAKGSGPIVIGSTATAAVTIGPSTLAWKGVFTSTFTAEFAAISSGQLGEATLSTATGTFADGDLISIQASVTAPAALGQYRLAADATTRVTMTVFNPTSTATSTGRVTGRITWIDLT